MKPVKVDLSSDIQELEIVIFSDEHIGDPQSDMQYLMERIEYVKSHENAYAVLNGDIIDNATKSSVSDTYAQTYNPQEQMDLMCNLFKPIKNKILGMTQGNHEARTYKKEGIDITKNVASRLGIENRYGAESVLIFLRFGNNGKMKTRGSGTRKCCYTIYMTHGSGSGRKEGSKVIRLADLASIVDADCYISGHTHLGVVMKEDFFRTDTRNSSFQVVTKLFVNSSANLKYGGYGETLGCKPACLDKPIIYLSGSGRELTAKI